MLESLPVSLAVILAFGVGAQWLAWRLRLPSILLLLLFGFAIGPVTGWLEPDILFGDWLFALVSLSVAIILFEGGLNLTYAELRRIGGVMGRLVSIGALVTWVLSTAAAVLVLGLDLSLAALFGAILTVTGPTVIGPLLRYVRPVGPVGPILKWEGIVIDPIGATLAVLVFEAVLAGDAQAAPRLIIGGVLSTALVGTIVGAAGAGLLIVLLARYWIPDTLQNAVVLMVVLAAFVLADALQHEAGLLAVTVMGIVLANQRWAPIRHIVEFKENLQVLLIGGLFIVLTARLKLTDVAAIGPESLVFLGAMILLVRPASVFLATIGAGLGWRERAFLAWMAPRGIVAASVASLFAIRLAEVGVPEAERLAPLTFLVIVGTVALYSLTARPVAQWLGLASPNPTGALLVGAHPLAQAIGLVLQGQGLRVLLVDTNAHNVLNARQAGLPAVQANILAEDLLDDLDLGGIGQLFALTSNDEVNALAAMEFAHVFGRDRVYQLAPGAEQPSGRGTIPAHRRGRVLFATSLTYAALSQQIALGAEIRVLDALEHDPSDLSANGAPPAMPLFLIDATGKLTVAADDQPIAPRSGQTLIALTAGEYKSETKGGADAEARRSI